MAPSGQRPGWVTALLETQRIPPGSRLSAWVNGESRVRRQQKGRQSNTSSVHCRKGAKDVATTRFHLEEEPPTHVLTRETPQAASLQSPVNFSRPLTAEGLSNGHGSYLHPAFASPHLLEPPIVKQSASQHAGSKQLQKPLYLRSKDARVQCKSIGTLVSGTLLTIVLATYLALAAANVVPTTAFHATFIFCIIILTMIFGHFLIRLCMLTVRLQPKYARRQPIRYRHRRRRRRQPDIEAAVDHSRVLSLYSHSHERPHDTRRDQTDPSLPAPPPAYGWWRGSVRIDPQDFRYNEADRSDLHQHTRSLIFAGSGHRPPSYTSNPSDTENDPPAPSFNINADRVHMRENAVRDV